MRAIWGTFVSIGLWWMAFHAWDGLESYDQFWRWCIVIELILGGLIRFIETWERALLPHLRTTEPVSVALKDCKAAVASIFVPDGIYNIEEGWKMERAAKAVLEAAGVKYE